MSLFNLQINFEKSKVPKDLLKTISKIISDSLSQNIEYVNGTLTDKVHLFWRGSAEPMAFLTIQTVQILDAEINQSLSDAIYKYLTNALDIPAERIIVYFTEKVLSDVAVNGSLLLGSS